MIRRLREERREAPEMKRQPVESKAIRSIGYERTSRVLELEFAAGTVYRYYDVPEFTFRALMLARSKHSFFVTSIEGRFRCAEVRVGDADGIS
jgi:hypothetical protein